MCLNCFVKTVVTSVRHRKYSKTDFFVFEIKFIYKLKRIHMTFLQCEIDKKLLPVRYLTKSQLAFFSKFVKKNTSTFMEQGHLSENEVNGYHFVNRHFRFSLEEFSF